MEVRFTCGAHGGPHACGASVCDLRPQLQCILRCLSATPVLHMSRAQMSLMMRYGGEMTLARCNRPGLLYLVGAEADRLRRSA